ncbi:pentapeptide repeat-containing protein [Micromonospora cathayae]|uniref:pentapeptide repeat-containing protein n=1 Tax=Micromonospora cathayae TaxID=3028804 RepID=UPI003C6D49B8
MGVPQGVADIIGAAGEGLRRFSAAPPELTGAALIHASLTHALSAGADLTRANLTQGFPERHEPDRRISARIANVLANSTANLARADLTDANLTCAKTDDRTRRPAGLPWPVPCDD